MPDDTTTNILTASMLADIDAAVDLLRELALLTHGMPCVDAVAPEGLPLPLMSDLSSWQHRQEEDGREIVCLACSCALHTRRASDSLALLQRVYLALAAQEPPAPPPRKERIEWSKRK